MPPAPETQAPTGRAGDEQPVMERGGGDAVILGAEVPPRAPTADALSSRLELPPAPPAGNELVVGSTPVVRPPGRRHSEKAASAPRLLDFRAASSSALDAEASSAAPPEWTPGGRTSMLNRAAQDVQAQLQAQGTALQQYTKAFLATRTAVRQHLGEAQTALRAKEEECSKAAQERDRLAKKLANQADQHKALL
nr:protein atonal homolog 8-like [Aegilops tauschii subsp. strangulata]